MNYLNDNVTYTNDNTDVTYVHVIQEDIMKTMSDVSKRLITQYITEWKQMKDGKNNVKCTGRTKLTGYKYSAKKNEVVVIDT
jgi:peptidyl-tRNA hydrolase